MTGRRDYPATALDYARDVVAGRLTACEWVCKACRRQLADLERARTDTSWPYEFNLRPEPVRGHRPLPGPADRICLFAEALPHIKGTGRAGGRT